MLAKVSHQHLSDCFDFLVKSSLFILLMLAVLTLSNYQQHTSTEIFIEKTSTLEYVLTSANHQVTSILSERKITVLALLNGASAILLLTTIVAFFVSKTKRYPKRKSSFAVFIVALSALIYPFVFGISVFSSSPYLATIFAILLPTLIYFAFRKKLNKTVANSHTLMVFASQSGSAYGLAKAFKEKIPDLLDVKCISHLTPACVNQYNQVLFIASTFGQGQPPDKAHRFIKHLERIKSFDNPIAYSVLALGDTSYQHYCAFGHQLSRLFDAKGAKPLTNVVEVDRMNESTINQWWHRITDALGWEASDVKHESFHALELSNSYCLNPSSDYRQVYRLCVHREGLNYQAGDLLEILPKQNKDQCLSRLNTLGISPDVIVTHNGSEKTILDALRESEWCQNAIGIAQQLADQLSPLTPRLYSIVSAPHQSEDIEIFVRRHTREDGTPGVASNYLAESKVGKKIAARIKTHPNFHLAYDNLPVVLIGAGTGIAPLISIIRELSAMKNTPPIWLFFGEQYQSKDFYFKTEIEAYVQAGIVQVFTPAWSRSDNKEYISDVIYQHQRQLKQWLLEARAHIYLCGNQAGFGNSTLDAIKQVLTPIEFERLELQDKLHIDLY